MTPQGLLSASCAAGPVFPISPSPIDSPAGQVATWLISVELVYILSPFQSSLDVRMLLGVYEEKKKFFMEELL